MLTRVVEVEHRRHGVDPQAVDVELVEPVQGVRDEEVADLAAAEVEDVGAPVELLAAARVGVLVERGAVEARERELSRGKCAGTQSRITPRPWPCRRSTNSRKSSGEPKRGDGA